MVKAGFYMRMETPLKMRMIHQCERLNICQAAMMKQALVKYLEEEEKIEAISAQR